MKKNKIFIAILAIFFSAVVTVFAEFDFSVIPPPEHPRLFLRKNDIANIKRNMYDVDIQAAWMTLLADSKVADDGNAPMHASGGINETLVRAVEANAMLYIINNDNDAGQKAVNITLNMLTNWQTPLISDAERHAGQMILTSAICYDWCYDLLLEQQKQLIVDKIKQLASELDCGYPPIPKSFLTGKGSEAQILRDMLAASVAVYDESPEIYQSVMPLLENGYVPARNFYYPSFASNQGESYGVYRFQWDMYASWIFKRMGYSNIFSDAQQFLPYRWLYTRRPDQQLMRDGDSSLSSKYKLGSYFNFTAVALLSSSYYQDEYLNGEFLKQNKKGYIDVSPIWTILFYQPQLQTRDLSELPLSMYFPSPGGYLTARTGWDLTGNSNDVVVDMKIGEYQYNNHQHLDAGSFQIYYKGALAMDSGIYQGTNGGYGSAHDINYYKRTIAHNSVLVYDEHETFNFNGTDVANDGGQYFPNNGKEPNNLTGLLENGYQVSQVKAHSIGPDSIRPFYSYIKGDLSDAYSGKVSKYTRSFVFMNFESDTVPAALIVFDRIEATSDQFPKKWLIHSVEEPIIGSDAVTIARTEFGNNGRLVNKTLLPKLDNILFDKIGGDGAEFMVNGINYPQSPRDNTFSEEPGRWRVEIGMQNNTAIDYFLNVMQMSDNNADIPLMNTELIETDNMYGTRVGNNIALFSKSGENIENTVTFTTGGGGEDIKFVLTDLASGTWTVADSSGSCMEYESIDGENVIYYIGNKNEYTITKK